MKWRRKAHDKVTPTLRDYVLRRDKRCIASRLDPTHECRNRWGRYHQPDDIDELTLDHVHAHAMLGKRASSDAKHLVAACWDANVNGWCSAHRDAERAYLATVEP